RFSGSAPQVFTGYEGGEYHIRTANRDVGSAAVPLPGQHTDTSLAVTTRVSPDATARAVALICRQQADGESQYRLLLWPEDRSFRLQRLDGGQVTDLVSWRTSEAIRRGPQPN